MYTAERVFWVPPEARWQNLQNQAARPDSRQTEREGRS
jgi:type I restriction enzyme M protein